MRRTNKLNKTLILSTVGVVILYFGYIKIVDFLRIDSCLDHGGSWDYAQKKCNFKDESEAIDTKYKIAAALRFSNSYVKDCEKLKHAMNTLNWVKASNCVTVNFKRELQTQTEIAYNKDPELGFGFDPIFDAQDYPSKGFEFESIDDDVDVLTLKGIDWATFRLKIKVVKQNESWLVDGCGIINMPQDQRIAR